MFGKSTSAGVIDIITAQPSFTFGTNAEFTVGNYNAIGGASEVTSPLIDHKLAGSFHLADRQRDGFYSVDTGQGPRTKQAIMPLTGKGIMAAFVGRNDRSKLAP